MKTTHDGDCWIYAIGGVCTCGLFHEMLGDGNFGQGTPFEKQIQQHSSNLTLLNIEEVDRLRQAIRKHRDAKGNDRCWENDLELYRALGEEVPSSPELPPREEFLRNCCRYYEGQSGPRDGCSTPKV